MGYVTDYRTATRTVTENKTGTRTAYREAYETRSADMGYDLIPIIRPNFAYFSFSGLRPNAPHWIFFDGKKITHFCNTSYNAATYNTLNRNNSIRNPGDKYIHETAFPTELGGPTAAAGQPVYSDASGNLDGLFYIQSNATTSFPTGNRTLVVTDLSVLDKEECLSWAQAEYAAVGEYELYYQYQHAYQEAYEETYQYSTSYQEEYQQSYQRWVDDPPPPVIHDPVIPVVTPEPEDPVVPDPPPEEEPPSTPTSTNSGAEDSTTTKKSSGGGNSTKYVHVHKLNNVPYGTGTYTNYYMTEESANAFKAGNGSNTWKDGKGENDSTTSKTHNNSKSIVCTEMYRQTQRQDWAKAMKIWDTYQRRYLTPFHEIGYHWLFKPYVRGMQQSTLLTKLGAYLAKERTQHLKYVLTKGRAKDSLVGNLWCKVIHPVVYVAGIVKTSKDKIMTDKRVKV